MSTKKGINMVIVDTETGGLVPDENPVLTLSAVRTSDGASFNVKIKPPEDLTISPEALKVTGINVDDLIANGITEKEAALKFREFLGNDGYVIAGCNFPFDTRFLNEMFKRNNIPSPLKHRCVDLQTAAFLAHERGLISLPKSRGGVLLLNLDAVCESVGVSRASDLHDSLEDVNLTRQCIEKCISLIKDDSRNKPNRETVSAKTNLVILDVETSGLNKKKHSILRVTAKRLSDGEKFDAWVKPEPGSFGDKRSLSKTGIDAEKLKTEGEELPSVLRKLSKFLSNSGPHILAGCNVSFDVDFIEEGCRKYGIRPPFGGKRVDLQTVAFVYHECGNIQLPADGGGVDLSFNSIAKACGISRGEKASREPTDTEIVHQCLEKCSRITFGKSKNEDRPLSKTRAVESLGESFGRAV
jgi:DNA polymerase III epsilon subunit-like protein